MSLARTAQWHSRGVRVDTGRCNGDHHGMEVKRAIIAGLERACHAVDYVAYRPVVVKATLPLPRWWRCDLSRLAVWLDDRWQAGYWGDRGPGPLCGACGRRTAWLTVGGYDPALDPEPPDEDDFMGHHPVDLCYWCRLDHDAGPITTDGELHAALERARTRSVSWSWRYPAAGRHVR